MKVKRHITPLVQICVQLLGCVGVCVPGPAGQGTSVCIECVCLGADPRLHPKPPPLGTHHLGREGAWPYALCLLYPLGCLEDSLTHLLSRDRDASVPGHRDQAA